MKYISLDERPEKKLVKFFMVIFGILCIFTSGWWALFLVKNPDNEKAFWLATAFLLVFGVYQVYAGLGKAARYILVDEGVLTVKQNAFSTPVKMISDDIEKIIIDRGQMQFFISGDKTFKLKLGLRYPDLGESIKEEVVNFAGQYNIEIEYKY